MTLDDLRTGLAWSRLARGRRARALRTLLEAAASPARYAHCLPWRPSGFLERIRGRRRAAPRAGPFRNGRRPPEAGGRGRAPPVLWRPGVSGSCARDHGSAAAPLRAGRGALGRAGRRARRGAPRVARGPRGRGASSRAVSPVPASRSSPDSRAGWTRRRTGRRSRRAARRSPSSAAAWTSAIRPSSDGLLESLLAAGTALSEFPMGDEPEPWHFPVRNRLIAGLARIVCVVEAAEKSGSLITARCATGYGRDVAAVPGPVLAPLSGGSNALLKDGAILVRDRGRPPRRAPRGRPPPPERRRRGPDGGGAARTCRPTRPRSWPRSTPTSRGTRTP